MHMKFNFCPGIAFLFLALAARAQTTAFTYQGQLISSNAPATGVFDLRFQIYNANSNVVAGPLTNAPVGVTNGLFTVTLDFGASVFDGSTRSLEIGVRSFNTSTNINTNAYAVLSPRQMLTSVPYAIRSLNASNALVLTEPLPSTNLIGTIPNSLLSPNVAVLTNNVIFSGSVTATNFIGNGFGLSNVPGTSLIGIITGNGSGLSNVPATSLTGTLPDARLSANVALQSNPSLNFAGAISATNFSGGGYGLTNVPGTFSWVTVAANTQAQPNVGYICNNGVAPVTITLPSLPSVGDVYKVAAVGAGGWIIKQNANQMIASGNLPDSIGENWTAHDSNRNWSAVASSADGMKLVATVKGGQIYTSTDSGVTWAPQRQQSQLVIRGLVGGRHQTGRRGGRQRQFVWLYLHLGQFRHWIVVATRQHAAVDFGGLVGGRHQTGRGGLWHAFGRRSRGLYFNQFGCELGPEQSSSILFLRGLFGGWHQTGRNG